MLPRRNWPMLIRRSRRCVNVRSVSVVCAILVLCPVSISSAVLVCRYFVHRTNDLADCSSVLSFVIPVPSKALSTPFPSPTCTFRCWISFRSTIKWPAVVLSVERNISWLQHLWSFYHRHNQLPMTRAKRSHDELIELDEDEPIYLQTILWSSQIDLFSALNIDTIEFETIWFSLERCSLFWSKCLEEGETAVSTSTRRSGTFPSPSRTSPSTPEANQRPSSARTRPRAPVAKTKSAKPSIPSNLLVQVDLDDDDEDLHPKYSAKMKTIEILIESKWNAHEPEEESFSARQHTSSRSRGTVLSHHRQDLDDFEKLAQHAEEHPSMISTTSHVDQVVLKGYSHFVQRLAEYPEDEEDEPDLTNHRIRQRKIKPLKTQAEPLRVVSDDDDEEEDRWNDVGVAKVILVIVDEHNSDSGISSLRMDFQKAQPEKKASSDFGDEHSWVERVTISAHNPLMLKTFPRLRDTQPPAVVAAPPSLQCRSASRTTISVGWCARSPRS